MDIIKASSCEIYATRFIVQGRNDKIQQSPILSDLDQVNK